MTKKNLLADAIGNAGGGTRAQSAAAPAAQEAAPSSPAKRGAKAPKTTVPVTGHYPPEVRAQLKILATERGVFLHELLGEAINDLFAKYGKPEIVPTSQRGK